MLFQPNMSKFGFEEREASCVHGISGFSSGS